MNSQSGKLVGLDISKLFSQSRSLDRPEDLIAAKQDLTDILTSVLDPTLFEHDKTTARRVRVWQEWLKFAEKLNFDAHETLFQLWEGSDKASAYCLAFLKWYAERSTVWRPCLGPEEWEEVRTIQAAVTLEDAWAALIQAAELHVFALKRKELPRDQAPLCRLSLSRGKTLKANPADAVAMRIPVIANKLGLSLEQLFVKREATEEHILILLHTLWSKADVVRCTPTVRNAVRNAIILQGISGCRPASVLRMKYKQVAVAWYRHPMTRKFVLAASITLHHVKVKKAKIQRSQRNTLIFTITLVPCAQICILSSLLAQALADNAFEHNFTSFSDLRPLDATDSDANYIPLRWKSTFLDKPIIPCSYHTYNDIWHRLHMVMGVRNEDSTRPYSLRVGAGDRLSGALTQCMSNFIMNHSTPVFELSYQAVHTQVPLAQLTFGSLAGEDDQLIKWTSSVLSRCDENAPVCISQAEYDRFLDRTDMIRLQESIQAAKPGSKEIKALQAQRSYILSRLEALQLAKNRKNYFEAVDDVRALRESASKLHELREAPRKLKPMPSCKTAIKIAAELTKDAQEPIVDLIVRYLRGDSDEADPSKKPVFICLLCRPPADLATKSSLTRHTKLHKDFLSLPFLCPQCQRQGGKQIKISGAPAWARHLGEYHKEFGVPRPPHSNNSQRQPCCPWCEKKFTAHGFLRHYNNKHRHNYNFPFDCPICKRSAASQSTELANDDAWCQHLVDSHAGDEFQPYAVFPEDLECPENKYEDSESGAATSAGLKRRANSISTSDEKIICSRRKRSKHMHQMEAPSDSAIEGLSEQSESGDGEQADTEDWDEELSDSERSSDEEGYGTLSDE